MEKAPISESDFDKIYQRLKNIDGVKDIHDLHIWSLSSKRINLTAHIIS